MPNPSIDGTVYQLRIRWMLHAQECLNVLCFKGFGVSDLDDDFAEQVITCLTNALIPQLSEQIILQGVDYKNMTGNVAQEGTVNAPAGTHGGIVGRSLPTTNALVISLKSSHVGRSGRGRMFVPGIPDASNQDSQAVAAAMQAATNFVNCMFEHFRAGDPPALSRFDWMVHSRKDNQFYPIVNGIARPVIATMRSRRVGG